MLVMNATDENDQAIANGSASLAKDVKDRASGCPPNPMQQSDSNKLDRLIVLMDIDATMLESKFFDTEDAANLHIASLPKDAEGKTVDWRKNDYDFDDIWILKFRPGLCRFLDEVSAIADLRIYTAGAKGYAHGVRREIESMCGKRYFPPEKVWSREMCTRLVKGGSYHKFICDLPLGRSDSSRVVLIDDGAHHHRTSPENVYQIGAFENETDDVELMHALDFLKNQLIPCKDVRPVLRARRERSG